MVPLTIREPTGGRKRRTNMRPSSRFLVLALGLTLSATACADDGGPLDEATDSTTTPLEPVVTEPTDETTDETQPAQPEQEDSTTVVSEPVTTAPANDDPSTTLQLFTPGPTTTKPTSGSAPVGSDEPLYPGQIAAGLQPFIDMATADLAERLGVDSTTINVISAVLVTWPDGSLGCPMPGMEYAQVLQDGSIIELGHAERVYRYHSGGNRTPFLCDQPLVKPPLPSGDPDA